MNHIIFLVIVNYLLIFGVYAHFHFKFKKLKNQQENKDYEFKALIQKVNNIKSDSETYRDVVNQEFKNIRERFNQKTYN
jgi:membrane-anchored glycerophosphoryl diester phosphodiesterase (GDPDase)